MFSRRTIPQNSGKQDIDIHRVPRGRCTTTVMTQVPRKAAVCVTVVVRDRHRAKSGSDRFADVNDQLQLDTGLQFDCCTEPCVIPPRPKNASILRTDEISPAIEALSVSKFFSGTFDSRHPVYPTSKSTPIPADRASILRQRDSALLRRP